MKEKFLKFILSKAQEKSWVGNRADPTACSSIEWKVGKFTVEYLVIFEVELKLWTGKKWVRLSYGKDSWFGKLAEWFYWELDGIKNPPMEVGEFEYWME